MRRLVVTLVVPNHIPNGHIDTVTTHTNIALLGVTVGDAKVMTQRPACGATVHSRNPTGLDRVDLATIPPEDSPNAPAPQKDGEHRGQDKQACDKQYYQARIVPGSHGDSCLLSAISSNLMSRASPFTLHLRCIWRFRPRMKHRLVQKGVRNIFSYTLDTPREQ